MHIRELMQAIRKIEATFQLAGKKSPFGNLKVFALLVDRKEHLTLAEFLDELNSQFAKPKARKPSKPPKAPREALVQSYSTRLTDAGLDLEKFGAAFQALSSDKSVTSPELKMVAELFIGAKGRGPSKKKILEDIEGRFRQRLFQNSKSVVVQKSSPW